MSSSKPSNTLRPNTGPTSTSTSTTSASTNGSTRTTNTNTPFASSPARSTTTSTRTKNTSYTSTSTSPFPPIQPTPKYPTEPWSAWKQYRGEPDKPDDAFIAYKKMAVGEMQLPAPFKAAMAGPKKEGSSLVKSSSDPTGLGFKTAVAVERARREETETRV